MPARNNPRKLDSVTIEWIDKKSVASADESAETIVQSENAAKEQVKEREDLLKLIGLLDLTTLNATDTRTKVEKITERAIEPVPNESVHAAAVCVYPTRVADVKNYITQRKATDIHIASVAAGFPTGMYRLESKLLEIALAIRDGADEIDIVINRPAALDDDWQTVYEEIAEMRAECGDKAHMKTILAVGELGDHERVYKASMVAMLAGSDFIKTSTGKETVNATYEYAYTMCRAIKDYFGLTGYMVGFKPAGGISTPVQAQTYQNILTKLMPHEEYETKEYFRIGASSLLDNIIKEL